METHMYAYNISKFSYNQTNSSQVRMYNLENLHILIFLGDGG